MRREELLSFLRRHRLCVQASVSAAGAPQAAVVGFAVTDALEFVFDTLDSTRKATNLRHDPRVSLVIGWDEGADERTVQIDGVADEPSGVELERLKAAYFSVFPDGVVRQTWTGIAYVRVRPVWLRYSDFRAASQRVIELDESALAALM